MASFRGIVFNSLECEVMPGRRQPTYAIPFSEDGAESTDLGRAPRQYKITALLRGNFNAQKDALIQAVEEAGPGLLVHPDTGRVLVIVEAGGVTIRTSQDQETNVCRISFSATEHIDNVVRPTPESPVGAVTASRLSGVVIARDALDRGLKVPAISDFVSSMHLDVLDTAIQGLRTANGLAYNVAAVPSGVAAQIDALGTQAASLLNSPLALFDAVQDIGHQLAEAVARTRTALIRTLSVISAAFDSSSSVSGVQAIPDIDTPERAEQRAGRVAIQTSMQALMLFEMGDAAAQNETFQSARATEQAINKIIDGMIALADGTPQSVLDPEIDPELAVALRLAAAKLSRYLASVRAQVTTYKLGSTVPVELVAYALYGDAERADEISDRNNIADPGGIEGLAVIEVAVE